MKNKNLHPSETPIRRLCKRYGIGVSELSRHFGIPLRTVQHWVKGDAKVADYLLKMIERLIEIDGLGDKNDN